MEKKYEKTISKLSHEISKFKKNSENIQDPYDVSNGINSSKQQSIKNKDKHQ